MNISHYRQSLQKKGLYTCIREAWKMVWPIYWVRDIQLREQILENRAYQYLKRRYLPLLNDFSVQPSKDNKISKIIWVCWLQGEENAPELVKRCIASMRQFASDYEVRVITNENMSDYVTIPAYITRHLEKKHMQMATFSDYLRTRLLVTYGGIWIDSTVLLTGELPEFISELPLFCFQTSPMSLSHIVASSWFLASQPQNPILQQVLYLFETYWKKEHRLRHYYLFHLLVAVVVNGKEENRKLWDAMPYVNNVDVHVLLFSLFKPYNKENWDHMCACSSVHKLTYKFKDPELTNLPNTNYRHILD